MAPVSHPVTTVTNGHIAARDLAEIGAGAGVLVLSTFHAHDKHVTASEEQVFTRLNNLPPGFTKPLYVLMQAGQFAAIPVTAALAFKLRRPRLALSLAVAGTGAWVLARVVKKLTGRGRPDAHLNDVVVRGKEWTGLGFPSGHAAVSAALAAAASPELPEPARSLSWTLVGIVSVSRIHVGAHLPIDTIGGVGLGLLIGRLASVILNRQPGEPA